MRPKRDLIKDRKIRLALVGAGRISFKHFEGLEKNKDSIEIIGVCDTDDARLEAVSKERGLKAYRSLDEVLKDPNVDLVTLCTPSGLHPEQVVQCAEAGKHVVTEKPMATRWKDGIRMVQACDRAGVELFVVKQNRFNSTLQVLKKAVDEGRFGRLYMLQVNVFWSRPQEYYDSSSWRGTWEFDGGALMNQASHYVDLMEWLGGAVQSVQAEIGTLARNIEVEDSAVLNLRYRTGALGSASVTMLTHNKNFEGSLTILGEKGTVRLGGVAVNRVDKWEFEEKQPIDEQITAANYETESVYGFGHGPYYRNVVEVLTQGAKPVTCGREGLKSLEMMIAAYLSARNGTRVSLPLEW